MTTTMTIPAFTITLVVTVTAPVAAATTAEGTVTTITRLANPFNMHVVATATTPVVVAATVEGTVMTTLAPTAVLAEAVLQLLWWQLPRERLLPQRLPKRKHRNVSIWQ